MALYLNVLPVNVALFVERKYFKRHEDATVEQIAFATLRRSVRVANDHLQCCTNWRCTDEKPDLSSVFNIISANFNLLHSHTLIELTRCSQGVTRKSLAISTGTVEVDGPGHWSPSPISYQPFNNITDLSDVTSPTRLSPQLCPTSNDLINWLID